MDLKGMYQEKAEELARERFNTEYEDLRGDQQYELYKDAEDIVQQGIKAMAEAARHDRKMGQGRVGRSG